MARESLSNRFFYNRKDPADDVGFLVWPKMPKTDNVGCQKQVRPWNSRKFSLLSRGERHRNFISRASGRVSGHGLVKQTGLEVDETLCWERNFFSLFPFLLFQLINLNERKKICRQVLISSWNIILKYWFFQRNSIYHSSLPIEPNLLHLSYSFYLISSINSLTQLFEFRKFVAILPTHLNNKLKP